MTTKSGPPKGTDQPLVADAGNPALENGDSKAVMQTDNNSDGANQTSNAELGTDIQGHLGRKLKASYDEIIRQPVPDRFRQLLEELERREKKE